MAAAAIPAGIELVRLIAWLTPIAVAQLQASRVMDEDERVGLLADLTLSNATLHQAVSTYRALPPRKSGRKRGK